MNIKRMSKKEYEKFRLVINISVFIAFLLVFIFVQVEHLRHQDIIRTLLAAMVLSSIFLILGVITIIPYYAAYAGKTFVVFSVLMALGEIYSMRNADFSFFSAAEFVLVIVLFLYGMELMSDKNKSISLKVLAKI